MASQESRESGIAPLKGIMLISAPVTDLRNLNSEMVDGTYAQSSTAELPRILLGVIDHSAKILPGGFGLYPDAIRESDVRARGSSPKGLIRSSSPD